MLIYTVENGVVKKGTEIQKFTLKGANCDIDTITIGEEGRGRELGILPVQLLNPWDGKETKYIFAGNVGKTKAGKAKIFETDGQTTATLEPECLVVFRTGICFRGGNSHTGDRDKDWMKSRPDYLDFPGKIICSGTIAQGIAGRMGDGEQIIAVMPANKVFRTSYSGRLYGAPSAHYYYFDGLNIISATWDERLLLDSFPAVETV